MFEVSNLCVIGLGYIGLPTAAIFAKSGVNVRGVDVNEKTVNTINEGRAHIVEVDLDGLLQGVVANGSLVAALDPAAADVFIIAVPTPFTGQRTPDLSFIEQATRTIAPYIQQGNLLILESTVPPGTTEKMTAWLEEERPDLKQSGGVGVAYHAAHCPERVLPGRVLIELVQNDRIIGGVTPDCSECATALYELFVKGDCITTNARTAELAKLSENAFRDVNIAYANELSVICDSMDIDVWELITLANRHPRVNILNPGPGVGGHCIAVDPWFIVSEAGHDAKIIRTAREVNDAKPEHVIKKVKNAAARFKSPTIACLGLAFKADIDDLRSSPALDITEQLIQEFKDQPAIKLLAVEPNISVLPPEFEGLNITLTDISSALNEADILLLLVDHRPFKRISRSRITEKIVIDTRGIWR